MPVETWYQAIGVVGASAVLVLAGCGSDEKEESIGDPLSRAAKGDFATKAAPGVRTATRPTRSATPSAAPAPATSSC